MPRKGLFYWIAMSDLKIQGEVSLSTEKAEAAFDRIGSKSAQMASRVEGAATEAGKAVDGIGAGAENGAEKLTRAESRMVASIKRTTQELQLLGKAASEKYEIKIDSKGLDTAKFAPYIEQLKAAEAAAKATTGKFKDTSDGFKNVGISAAQMQAALRGVPAQFTDIATSLASGQQPLTVLLQQGGQLKDMFGGIGPAAKALGGYVLGLVNPLTLAAGAVVGLAVAYNQGSKEADAYAKALILTGNAAGTTSNILADMAARIGKGTGTQGAAAAALAEMAATGRIAAGNLEYFSRVAIQMEKTVGQSAKDTAKDLAELGKSPLDASEKLNEKYHYLTAAVYAQIKALKEQGKEEEAAAVAQKAYASAFDERTKQIQANLGIVESAFRDATGLAKSFWDTVLNVGRKDTLAESMSKISESIAIAQSKVNENSQPGGGLINQWMLKFWQERLGTLKQEQSVLQENLRLEQRSAATQAESARLNEARIAWDKEGEKYLSRAAQLEREILKTRNEGVAAGASEAEIQKRIGDIRKKYSDIFNDGINSQIEALKRRGQVEDEIMRRSIAQLQLKRQIGAQNEEDSINAVAQIEIEAFDRREKALKSELELATRKQNSLQEQKALIGQLQVLNEQRLTREQQLQNDLLALDVKRTRAAANQYADMVDAQEAEFRRLRDQVIAQEDYNAAIGLSKTAVAALDAERLRALATQKEERANLIELTDISGELTEQYRKQAQELRDLADKKIAGAQKEALVDVWKSVDGAAHDAFVNILQNGKNAFDRLRDSLKSGLYDLLYQMTVKKWIFSIGATVTGAPSLASAAEGPSLLNTGASGLSLFNSAGALSGLGAFGGGASAGASQLFAGVSPSAAFSSIADVSAGSMATAAGQAIGYLGPMAAAAVASVMAARAISDGYKVNGVGNVLNFAGIGGGLVNRAFGMRARESDGFGFEGTFSDDGFSDGRNFSRWKQKGGWFRSDKGGTDYSALDAAFGDSLSDGFKLLKASSVDFAKTLGLSADSVADYKKRIVQELTGDQAKDAEIVAGVFKDIGNELATSLLPTFEQFAKKGEDSAAVLQRLGSEYKAVDSALTAIGMTFGQVGISSSEARTRLVDLVGGVDALASGAAFFAQNFLTEAERIAPTIKAVQDGMAALGYASVDTRDEFKNLVKGLDVGSEAGAKLYAQLMAIAPGFAQVADYSEKLAAAAIEKARQRSGLEIQIMELSGDAAGALAAQRAAELAGMDESLRPLQERIYLLQDEKTAADAAKIAAENAKAARQKSFDDAMKGVDLAFSAVQRAVEAERKGITSAYNDQVEAFNLRIKDVTGSISKLSSVSNTLKSTLDRMRSSSDRAGERAAASAAIDTALLLARAGGIVPDPDKLTKALDVISQPAEDLYTSFVDYQRDQLVQRGKIEELANLTDSQLSVEELTLRSLEDQQKLAERFYKEEMNRLDGVVLAAQAQIDVLNGIDKSVMSVAAAVAGLQIKINAAGAAQAAVSNGAGTQADMISSLYKNILGRDPRAEGATFWQNALATNQKYLTGEASVIRDFIEGAVHAGGTDEERARAWARANGIQGFDVGTNYVPRDRLALIHEGERVLPKADNRALIAALANPQGSNAAIVERLDRVCAAVERLQQTNSAENQSIAQHANKTAKALERAMPEGDALAVRVEA